MTDDLLALGDWLAGAGCTHVAMESTSVYWKPIYNLLEGSFELLLVNARHVALGALADVDPGVGRTGRVAVADRAVLRVQRVDAVQAVVHGRHVADLEALEEAAGRRGGVLVARSPGCHDAGDEHAVHGEA